MAKKATKTSLPETLEPRVYEVGYLLSPAVRDEDLAARVDELKESLTKIGATIFAEGNAEFIDLAYEMSKIIDNKRVRFNQGYFGWLKFEIDPSRIAELKELLDADTTLIRYLLILAPRENTVIGKKPLGKILKAGKREVVADNEEEVDAQEETVVSDDEVQEEATPEVEEETTSQE